MPPPDRRFEGSLSDTGTFRPEGAASKNLRFLPREQPADAFLDLTTGEEVSVGLRLELVLLERDVVVGVGPVSGTSPRPK